MIRARSSERFVVVELRYFLGPEDAEVIGAPREVDPRRHALSERTAHLHLKVWKSHPLQHSDPLSAPHVAPVGMHVMQVPAKQTSRSQHVAAD